MLQSIDTTVRESQVLCLSPTRELAVQIQKVVLALGDYMNVQCHSCIGGTNLGEDIRKLDYGQHVVSGIYFKHYGMGKISTYILLSKETIRFSVIFLVSVAILAKKKDVMFIVIDDFS